VDSRIKKAYPLESTFNKNISKIREGYAYERVYTRKGLTIVTRH
jgi:hypothetical protein